MDSIDVIEGRKSEMERDVPAMWMWWEVAEVFQLPRRRNRDNKCVCFSETFSYFLFLLPTSLYNKPCTRHMLHPPHYDTVWQRLVKCQILIFFKIFLGNIVVGNYFNLVFSFKYFYQEDDRNLIFFAYKKIQYNLNFKKYLLNSQINFNDSQFLYV